MHKACKQSKCNVNIKHHQHVYKSNNNVNSKVQVAFIIVDNDSKFSLTPYFYNILPKSR